VQNGTQPPKANGEIKAVTGLDEYHELSNLIKSSKPEIVRQVVRDHWQRCLIGSDFHVGFIVSPILDDSGSLFQRTVF
jgi:DNA-binding MltR family transcriptional regulator